MFPSVQALLSAVVDYAGLFPPAQLDLPDALQHFVAHHASPHRWLLNRFVIPAARLTAMADGVSQFSLASWPVSVIIAHEPESTLDWVLHQPPDAIAVSGLEFSSLSPSEIAKLIPLLPSEIDTFFEVSLQDDWVPYLAMLQGTGAGVKIRTGGLTPEAFPDPLRLSQFMVDCAQAQVPFKATAGLHHPLAGHYRLTSQPESAIAPMQGFLAVAIAAALADCQQATVTEVLAVLQASSLAPFQFGSDGLTWCGSDGRRFQLSLAELQATRQRCFRSFGSCSFSEPVQALQQFSLLPMLHPLS